jgi:UDP-N-acetylmuramoyl-tripeptide--D-alanyl-D-alanine ligase
MTDVPPPASEGPAFSADELARATGGTLLARSDRPIRGGAVDSRLVRPGVLFVALPGERTDGHLHLGAAAAAGAAALLVTRPPTDVGAYGDVTVLRVADGLHALGAAASAWRARFRPLVVGITGSIAKTSTKEAVAAVLGRRFRTLSSEGNQNNEIGLPLTVLELGPGHEAAVLEMGMYVGGEIADLARIARPSIGVVTAVQGVHLSRIGSLDAIEAAKRELVEALPADGVAVLNADDLRVRAMAQRTAARSVRYGFADDADVGAEAVASAGFEGMRFTLRLDGSRWPATIPALGRLAVHNALAAAAVGRAAGMDAGAILDGLAGGWGAPHRGQLIRAGGAAIVDDSYNASPGSVRAALELLAGLPGRRIAVLGEMLELGPAHEAGHRDVGAAAAAVVDLLLVVGPGAGTIADGAIGAGLDPERVLRAPDRDAALDLLGPRLREGDVVLVKASRGAALDELVSALTAGPGAAAQDRAAGR